MSLHTVVRENSHTFLAKFSRKHLHGFYRYGLLKCRLGRTITEKVAQVFVIMYRSSRNVLTRKHKLNSIINAQAQDTFDTTE